MFKTLLATFGAIAILMSGTMPVAAGLVSAKPTPPPTITSAADGTTLYFYGAYDEKGDPIYGPAPDANLQRKAGAQNVLSGQTSSKTVTKAEEAIPGHGQSQ